MQKVRKVSFPKETGKILKGFGPAFLVIALGIGSGEFILWPYLSAHYGFGILWGALLGISIQLLIIVVLERHTAFLGESALSSFTRVFRYAFWWILISTLIGFGWPGFSAMSSQLLVQGLNLPLSEFFVAFLILIFASLVLLFGKSAYKNILRIQKINMSFLLVLVIFLFVYYFDGQTFIQMLQGIIGIGKEYTFIPIGLSLITFLGAVAYAGSGGNLLLINSFYVEQEQKGLVKKRLPNDDLVVPDESSRINTHLFTKNSLKQNTLFFWTTGLILILLLAYISYAVLNGVSGLPEDFTFLVREATIFSHDIHPFIGKSFIFLGAFALFGVQLGILDFIGRIASNKNQNRVEEGLYKKRKHYQIGVTAMTIFGLLVLALGLRKPNILILVGSTINAFSMGVITWLLYRVEIKLLPKYVRSFWFSLCLVLATIFYIGFFLYVVWNLF